MKKLLFLFSGLALLSCKNDSKTTATPNFEIHFLDDYTIPAIDFKGTEIGGLSGIDYNGQKYILISDQKKDYRFYTAQIKLKNRKIDTIIFEAVTHLQKDSLFSKKQYLDLEGIRFFPNKKTMFISSEGSVSRQKNPGIFSVSPKGKLTSSFPIKDYFEATSEAQPRNNGLFEGITLSADQKGFWVAAELPLKADGPEPTLHKTISPARITYYDLATKKPTKQVVYLLDSITKVPKKPFHVNGISSILTIAPEKLLVIERAYSAGLGNQGNSVRLYVADVSKATNTADSNALKTKMDSIVPAHKTLLFDFEGIKNKLSVGFIDNIEGITFGPVLENGNQSLILISDNNFNQLGEQINQVILMELILPQTK